jgi:multiple sugar transport system permease protein
VRAIIHLTMRSPNLTRRWPRISSHLGLYLMLTPYLLGVTTLVLIPTLVTLALSVTRYDIFSPPVWIGLGNFTSFLSDPLFQRALINSLWFAIIGVSVRVTAALLLALALNRAGRTVAVARATVYLPSIIPDIAYALVWLLILNPGVGPVNLLLGGLGLPTPAWTLEPTTARASIVVMWAFQLGEGFVLLVAALQAIPRELFETATLDGASAWRVFWSITLPLMVPALLLLCIRDTALSFQGSFVPGMITTETGPYYATYFLPHYMFDTAIGRFRYGYASAITVTMYLITAGLIIVQYLTVRRWSAPHEL